MRKAVISAALVLGLLVPAVAAAPPASASGRVFCTYTTHVVKCFNYTPYRVFLRVVVRTTAGPKVFKGWFTGTKWSRYLTPVINSVTYTWHF